jgi:hypothetical protein
VPLTACSPQRFAALRIVLGLLLATFFADLAPYAAELFSREGVFPVAPSSALPNLLSLADGPAAVTAFVAALALVSLLFALGVFRGVAALLLWYGLACLVARNPGIANPSLPFLGWLLLACAVAPPGEPWRLGAAPDPGWRLPRLLFSGGWWIAALAYSASGLDKLTSTAWTGGSALALAAGLPFAREFAGELARAAPPALVALATWAALATELLFAPLAAWRVTRPWIWLAATAMHALLLLAMAFPELSLGMLVFHLFLFDERWLRRRPPDDAPSPAPAAPSAAAR